MRASQFLVAILYALVHAASVLSMCDNTLISDGIGLSKKSIGFLGCGKISSAVVRGYAGKINCPICSVVFLGFKW